MKDRILKMKKLILVLLFIALAATNLVSAKEKTDDELLRETVLLSGQVKEYGKTLGIEPTAALSKSAKEQKPVSIIILYTQKRGSLKFTNFKHLILTFHLSSGDMSIKKYSLYHPDLSIFVRQVDEFSGDESVITLNFAKQSAAAKVATILHEDLHGFINIDVDSYLSKTQEILVTPLGFIAALKFFEYKNDPQNIIEISRQITYFRTMSKELNALENEKITCPEIYEIQLLDKFPVFKARFDSMRKSFSDCIAEEAIITHELRYWKYFDKVFALYEKSNDLKTLIEDMKKAPGKLEELEKYMETLDAKYSPVIRE